MDTKTKRTNSLNEENMWLELNNIIQDVNEKAIDAIEDAGKTAHTAYELLRRLAENDHSAMLACLKKTYSCYLGKEPKIIKVLLELDFDFVDKWLYTSLAAMLLERAASDVSVDNSQLSFVMECLLNAELPGIISHGQTGESSCLIQ